MASVVHHAATMLPGGSGDAFEVVKADGHLLMPALLRLIGPTPPLHAKQDVNHAVSEFSSGLTKQTTLWAARYADGSIGQVAMIVPAPPGAGRTLGCFLSPSGGGGGGGGAHRDTEGSSRWLRASSPEEVHRERVAALMHGVRVTGGGAEWKGGLAQGLIEPEETDLLAAYRAAGFERLADLLYMRRDLPRFGRIETPVFPAGVTLTPVSSLDADRGRDLLLRAMNRSYIDTLDCPALCGLRDARDVLDSHFAVGAYDPSLWWVILDGGVPEGCMLLSRYPKHQTVELVYVGLGPTLRGRGLGSLLMQRAQAELQQRGERCLACAVDANNAPAIALYKKCRFRQFARRVALIRSLP